MKGVRSTNTSIEWTVRRALFGAGFRYRLHCKELPGSPDIVFPGKKKAIFVHGCFWHQHKGCKRAKRPETNRSYWLPKLRRNIIRDLEALVKLRNMGWHAMVIWECELRDREKRAISRAIRFLDK